MNLDSRLASLEDVWVEVYSAIFMRRNFQRDGKQEYEYMTLLTLNYKRGDCISKE